jgi:hypothetical protein
VNRNQTQSHIDFSLVAAPSAMTVVLGGAAQATTVVASPMNRSTGGVAVTVGSLPGGVMATPLILASCRRLHGKDQHSSHALHWAWRALLSQQLHRQLDHCHRPYPLCSPHPVSLIQQDLIQETRSKKVLNEENELERAHA